MQRRLPFHYRHSLRGSTMVEFALVFPVFLLFMLGVFQFAITYYRIGAINNAAREGARYGVVNPTKNNPGQPDSIQSYAQSRAGQGFDPAQLAISVEYPPTQVQDPDTNAITTVPNKMSRGDRIRVTASYPMFSILPGLQSFIITKSSTMRIEVDT